MMTSAYSQIFTTSTVNMQGQMFKTFNFVSASLSSSSSSTSNSSSSISSSSTSSSSSSVAAGFTKQFWYKLLDEEGKPISNATVFLYEFETMNEIYLVDQTQPLTTDSMGIFTFYVADEVKSPSNGYPWEQEFTIRWFKDSKNGIIEGDHLFGEFAPVNLLGSSTRRNKAISNSPLRRECVQYPQDFRAGTTEHFCDSGSNAEICVHLEW